MLKTYTEKLEKIQNETVQMSQDILDALEDTLKAVKNEDVSILKKINISEKKLMQQSSKIDNLIVTTIALNSPEAKDLRKLIALLKVTNLLVGVGLNIKNFSKLFRKNYSDDLNTKLILEYTIPLQKSTIEAFRTSVNMLDDEEDIENRYKKILLEEVKTDDLYSMVEKNILKTITKNIDLSRDYINILSALRTFEKIADKSVSIGNLLQFAHLGGEIQ